MSETPDILRRIVEQKRLEVAAARDRVSLDELRRRAADLPPTRSFEGTLRAAAVDGLAVIAEVKKGSPSKGVIRPDFDPVAIAVAYAGAGAACISVLTDEKFFLGNLSYLAAIRNKIQLPLLRKDFLYDEYQVYEARTAGADAILLIAAMLETERIRELAQLAHHLSLDVLLEVHDEEELDRALSTDISLIGVNNRNLRTFVTDLGVTERLAPRIAPERLLVAESGIETGDDIRRLLKAGAGAFLIGETFMRSPDPGEKLRGFRECIR